LIGLPNAEVVSTSALADTNGAAPVQLGASASIKPLSDNGSPLGSGPRGEGSTPSSGTLQIVPLSLTKANEIVGEKHRHNAPLRSFLVFALGVADNGRLCGAALVGRTANKTFEDGYTLEIRRVACDGTKNANSMLYGACARAAKALGYRRLITYTLPSESGASLKATGWINDGVKMHHATTVNNPHARSAILRGDTYPLGPKRRWRKIL
jgi:hypothetical protein